MIKTEYIIGNSKNLKNILNEKKLPNPSLIVSSPPYFDILNYEDHEEQIGHRSTDYGSYIDEVSLIYQDCYEICSQNASLWIIMDTFKKKGSLRLLPFDIVNNLNAKYKETWILKEVIIWDKEKNLPWNGKGKFKNQFEYILYFTKGKNFQFHIDCLRELLDLKKWWKTYPERYNANGKAPSNIWSYTTPIRGWGNSLQNHFCPLPFPLAERILTLASKEGDVVFDPFAGSGTFLALAECMDRISFGIDININYKNLFEEEVIFGAKRYWNNRKVELERNENLVTNFKSTIKNLRKQKYAYLLCLAIKKIFPEIEYSILLEDEDITSATYYVFSNSNINLNVLNEHQSLIDYIKQAKIIISLKKGDNYDIEGNNVVFQYKLNKFYRYIKNVKSEELLKYNSNYFYSTVKLEITD